MTECKVFVVLASKINLSTQVASAAVLQRRWFCYCVFTPIVLCVFVFGPCIAVQYLVSLLVRQLLYFNCLLMSFDF